MNPSRLPLRDLAALVEGLRKAAVETPEEYERRWPYNWKVTIDSKEARAILAELEPLLAEEALGD